MAGKTAILSIRILSDAKDGKKGLDETGGSVDKLVGKLDKVALPAAAASAAIVALAKSSADAASEAQQSMGAVQSVFKEYAGQVESNARQAADSVGLAASEYGQFASVVGSQLKNMGVPLGEVADRTDWLIKLGGDLAATYGGTTADAVGALSSLLRGERDPIERYGVSINQAAVDAQLAAMGLEDLSGEAEKNANLQATLALLTAQTADAQGQFARETDSAAGAQQIATARWKDAQAALGEALLPLMVDAAGIAADLARWVTENSDAATVLIGVVGILAGGVLALNGALRTYQAVQAIATAATWASNAAWYANPVTWVIAAILLLIGIVVLLATHWDEVTAAASDFWNGIVEWIQPALDWLTMFLDTTQQIVDLFFGSLASGDWSWFADIFAQEMQVGVDYTMPPTTQADSMTYAAWDEITRPARFTNLRSTQAAAGDTYNVTVNGALDPVGTGRTIARVLDRYKRTTGTIRTAGVSWAK